MQNNYQLFLIIFNNFRDLKPENLLMTSKDDNGSIKLVDFLMIDVNGYEHEVLTGIDFGDVNFGLIGIQWHDYNWNNKSNDFTYLGDYGYSYLTMAGTVEIWANNLFPLINRERYKTNL